MAKGMPKGMITKVLKEPPEEKKEDSTIIANKTAPHEKRLIPVVPPEDEVRYFFVLFMLLYLVALPFASRRENILEYDRCRTNGSFVLVGGTTMFTRLLLRRKILQRLLALISRR